MCGGTDFTIVRDETSTNAGSGLQVPLGMTRCQQCGQLYELSSSAGCPMCSATDRNSAKDPSTSLGMEQVSQHLMQTNKLLQNLIDVQRETRKALRWSLGALGFILLVAFYVVGVNVHGAVTILGR